jgi:GntR family transcriptional regulator
MGNKKLNKEKTLKKMEPRQHTVLNTENILYNIIMHGEYVPHNLPNENVLAKSLGVSRATVRTALRALELEGLIYRRQRIGTQINNRAIEIPTQIGPTWDFNKLIMNSGYKPTIRLLDETRRLSSSDESSELELKIEEEVLSIHRVFLADECPAVYSIDLLPVKLVVLPYPAKVFLGTTQSFLLQYCQQEPTYSISEISAISAENDVSNILNAQSGTPIIKYKSVFYNQNGLVLLMSNSFCSNSIIKFRFARSYRS